MKKETNFRTQKVDPYLKKLPNSFFMSIQQVAIHGTPDKIGVISSYFVGLELKSGDSLPTKLQAYTLDQIAKAGGVALVVRPDNWEQIKNLLWGLANSYLTPQHLPNWRTFV